LTLDEFFANLEKTGESSEPMAATMTTTSNDYHNRQQMRRRQHHEKNRNNDVNEVGMVTEVPVADMGSFFDEVNALVKRKQNENQETVRNRTKASTSFSSTQHNKKSVFTSIHRPSILDILPPPLSEKDNYDDSRHYNYDVESWNQYVKLLEENMEGPKFLKIFKKRKKIKSEIEHHNHQQASSPVSSYDDETTHRIHQLVDWLRSPRPVVETHLPTLRSALRGEYEETEIESNKNKDVNENTKETNTTMVGINTLRSRRFREELNAQRQRFMSEMGWTTEQYEAANGVLVFMGSICAKTCAAAPLDIAWSKLKETGFPMDNKKDVLHNYLYVSSTFSLPKRKTTKMSNNDETEGDEGAHTKNKSIFSVLDFLNETTYSSSSNNTNYEIGDIDEEELDVSAEVAVCHDFLHEATEQSTGIHVRRLVSLGKANKAERLLAATMENDDLRLRTYAPIFQSYLDQGDVSAAFKLFVKMKGDKNVLLQPETFVQLIACIAENGYFRIEAKPIAGTEDLPYSKKCGPNLFNDLASELADICVEISSASAKRLYNAFQRGNDPNENLKQLHLLESLKTNNDLAKSDELIVSRVRIDQSTGRCPRSGAQLRLINLDPIQKIRFQDALLNLVSSSYRERHRNSSKPEVADKLRKFGEWLQNRSGKPFTAIIDGPNIAYYMQNFQQGTFNYHQIKFVVDALEDMGENVLVVLPKKYTYNQFSLQKATQKVKQILSPKEKEIRDGFINKGKAFVVPVGSLDDYYWMFASVCMDEDFVPPDNPEGRWPGTRPMLISNDKLRDHKMWLLEPRLFRRWYSSFLVNFTFSAFVDEICTDREIGFRTADFYSREIQGNPVVDSKDNLIGEAWHFPVGDWDENEHMCIRIPL